MKLSEDLQVEILLVYGVHGRRFAVPFRYWPNVWNYLVERYPDMLKQYEYPDGWADDADHAHDMNVLRDIHEWQRKKKYETQRGLAS